MVNPRAVVNNLIHSYKAIEVERSLSTPGHQRLVTIIRQRTIESRGVQLQVAPSCFRAEMRACH